MRLKKILLRQFRNYEECRLEWHSDINIIYGKNAQGKTNLLEAISYLSAGASFREQSEQKLENWNSDFFYLEAELERAGDDHIISAGYQQRKKLWKKDGAVCKKMSQVVGFLHTVVFTPDDLEIVKKGPEQRRHFLNLEMVQIFGGYHRDLNTYKKALAQRNNLLKQIEFQGIRSFEEQDLLLRPWEEQLAAAGAVITIKRLSIINRLNEIAGKIHRRLSCGAEQLELTYEPSTPLPMNIENQSEAADYEKAVANKLLEMYCDARPDDLRRGFSTVGPHRDDFRIAINDVDARIYGSQGQQRTAALSIKLSELELVRELNGYYPILLLDDVLSELDKNRRAALLRMALNKSQIFITSTDIDQELLDLAQGSFNKYHIKDGNVTVDHI